MNLGQEILVKAERLVELKQTRERVRERHAKELASIDAEIKSIETDYWQLVQGLQPANGARGNGNGKEPAQSIEKQISRRRGGNVPSELRKRIGATLTHTKMHFDELQRLLGEPRKDRIRFNLGNMVNAGEVEHCGRSYWRLVEKMSTADAVVTADAAVVEVIAPLSARDTGGASG